MFHVATLGRNTPQVPIVKLVPAADVAEQDVPEPPQELAPPTAFAASVFDKADKLEDQEVNDIVQVSDAAAVEAEPMLKKATQTGASAYDFTVTHFPAPPAGTAQQQQQLFQLVSVEQTYC